MEGIIKIWKDAKLRGNGHKKAMLILAAAMRSYRIKKQVLQKPGWRYRIKKLKGNDVNVHSGWGKVFEIKKGRKQIVNYKFI